MPHRATKINNRLSMQALLQGVSSRQTKVNKYFASILSAIRTFGAEPFSSTKPSRELASEGLARALARGRLSLSA